MGRLKSKSAILAISWTPDNAEGQQCNELLGREFQDFSINKIIILCI
jgi:hypothetical protein